MDCSLLKHHLQKEEFNSIQTSNEYTKSQKLSYKNRFFNFFSHMKINFLFVVSFKNKDNVLNGIAFDESNQILFLTGF